MEPGALVGPYEIVARIGAGGMGEVFRARDTRLGRDVAIKVLPAAFAADPDRLRRFQQEARATAALSDPNILAIHDVGSHGGQPYLVEELLEGESLRARLCTGPVPLGTAVEWAVQVAHGLAAAHAKGVVHRDLKPENLFLTSGGHVKILDFGLAKLLQPESAPAGRDAATTRVAETEAGQVVGTLGYMAPEQLRGRPCDHRADLFSFGCVLYELLSGERAFLGESPADTISEVLSRDPAPLSASGREIPPALQEIVRRCLEKRPEDRFSSAHDLALALHAVSGSGPSAAPTAPWRPPPARRVPVPALVAAALGAVATVALLAALYRFRPWESLGRAAGPARPSVVALPCRVLGAADLAWLADAVPQTISTLLAQVDGLDTRMPPSSLETEKVGNDPARIAGLYGVSLLVVTSLTATPEAFQLNVQLVDVPTRNVRWSRLLEAPRSDYNGLARRAADGIRDALRPSSAPIREGTTSSEVELALRRGDYHAKRYGNLGEEADLEIAMAAYRRALELDPRLAAAVARIGMLHASRSMAHGSVEPGRTEMEAWGRRALGIDPLCAEGWVALSAAEMSAVHPDAEQGIRYALKAVANGPLDPLAHNLLGSWLGGPGTLGLFAAGNLRAFELDPFLLFGAGNAAVGLAADGKTAEALAVLDRALGVEPEHPWLRTTRAWVLARAGRLEESGRDLAAAEASATQGSTTGPVWKMVALVLAVEGRDAARADALAREVVAAALDPKADATLVGNACGFAVPALARMGRTADALRLLERSIEIDVDPAWDWLQRDPDLAPLRGDPRFGPVREASRAGAAKAARILSEARDRGELPRYMYAPLEDLRQLLDEGGGARDAPGARPRG